MAEPEIRSYRCQLKVRGYELDSFGHVNHAVYIRYLEQARWELLAQEGITPAEFAAWQRWPVIASLEARYLQPTHMHDLLEIRTRVAERTRTTLTFEQEIWKGSSQVLGAHIRAVIVNEKGRPAELPAGIARLCPPPAGKGHHEKEH
jgi:acyl-CoA thioester hydrolase